MARLRFSVVGHSHVKRINFLRTSNRAVNEELLNTIAEDSLQLSFLGASGLKFKHIFSRAQNISREKQWFSIHFREILRFRPHAILLMLGDNDVMSHSPEELAMRMCAFATHIQKKYGVKNIILGQILPRFSLTLDKPDPKVVIYNKKALEINSLLKNEVKNLENIFFQYHGFGFPGEKKKGKSTFSYDASRKFFRKDGVHLTCKGYMKIIKRIKNSIVQEATHFNL